MRALEMRRAATSQRDAGRSDPNVELLGGGLKSEITNPFPDLQEIRISWLARRHRLAPQMAVVLAALAFGEART